MTQNGMMEKIRLQGHVNHSPDSNGAEQIAKGKEHGKAILRQETKTAENLRQGPNKRLKLNNGNPKASISSTPEVPEIQHQGGTTIHEVAL